MNTLLFVILQQIDEAITHNWASKKPGKTVTCRPL